MKRILVVEDEDVIRDFVVINLKRSGYDVTDVSNGEDALRVFDENDGNFDVALLDIMMPGIDGLPFAKKSASVPTPSALLCCRPVPRRWIRFPA